MPEGHVRLIETVAAANPNTVVVLFCGGVVELPWADKVRAVLYMGLPGQAGGAAAANLLTGKANPSGKLTETWPVRYQDVPSRETFGQKTTHYKEGLYVGYRYYDKAGTPVRYAFGHGLSYTGFACSDLKMEGSAVSLTVTNTGSRAGAEVVQLYLAPPQDGLYRPQKELKGFSKVMLAPGEAKRVTFPLDERSFAVWADGWKIPGGTYEVLVGTASDDIRLRGALLLLAGFLVSLIRAFSGGTVTFDAVLGGMHPIGGLITLGLGILWSLGGWCAAAQVGRCAEKGSPCSVRYTTVTFCPAFLFVFFASLYWILRAFLLHFVPVWKLFRRLC